MKKLFALSLLGLMACVAEPAVEEEAEMQGQVETEPTSDPSLQKSYATAPVQWRSVATAACFQQWECDTCSNGRPRNVLREYCDDGSVRAIVTGSCGQMCF